MFGRSVYLLALLLGSAWPCLAQQPIYRCGSEYTNSKPASGTPNCKVLEGGNVTVVQGTRVTKVAPAKAAAAATSASAGKRQQSATQQAREADARLILQAELKKALARQEELQKEYQQGEPDKRADETRNHQKYLNRVAELSASMARIESDIAGIRRELDRLATPR